MSQKVAYVTGGMGGIGTAICQRLHKDGFKVIAGCGPSRDYDKWLGEQKAQGYTFYASVGNVGDWNSTVEAFSKAKAEHGSIDVLVATDVAARGLDIAELPCVINYDLPYNAEDYVHRIGRTGRAGASGIAMTLVTREDARLVSDIEKLIKKKIELEAIELDDDRPRRSSFRPREEREERSSFAPSPAAAPRRSEGISRRCAPPS